MSLQGTARGLVTRIAAALDAGENEAAARDAAQGLAAFPDAAIFRRLHGAALLALGAFAEAKTELTTALAVDPLNHDTLLALARLAEAEGDRYTAAEHLLTAWEHDPVNAELRVDLTQRLAALYGNEGYLQYTRPALAALYARNAYPERAAREYAAALAEQPNRTDLRLAVALGQWRLGQLAEAVATCTDLLAERPTLARARWALADALARLSRGEEAREQAKNAARLDPDGAIARDLLAGNPDTAIVDPDEPLSLSAPMSSAAETPAIPETEPVTDVIAAAEATEIPLMPAPELADEIAESPAPTTEEAHLAEAVSELRAALSGLEATLHETEPPADADTNARAEAAFVAPTESDEPPPAVLPHARLMEEIAPTEAATEPPSAESAPDTTEEPEEAVTVVAKEDGELVAALPGGEPLLDATDALPLPDEPQPEPARELESPTEPQPESPQPIPAPEPVPELEPVILSAPPAVSPNEAEASPRNAEWARTMMEERLAAGDSLGAVGYVRIALTAAGADTEQVRALLPVVRALAGTAADQPEARRLLGDTYRRLGQFAQAQGQYRQALLMRVAGRKARAGGED